MTAKVFTVGNDGALQGLHFDDFDLGRFGPKKVERASEIFFNSDTQFWDILLPSQDTPHPYATSFASYDRARRFEVEWLQACRLAGIDPLTEEGNKLCGSVRATFGS